MSGNGRKKKKRVGISWFLTTRLEELDRLEGSNDMLLHGKGNSPLKPFLSKPPYLFLKFGGVWSVTVVVVL